MVVVLERHQGEAFVIKFREKDGSEQSVVVYLRKVTPSKVHLCISDVPESENVRIHRIEHFTGEEFKNYIEGIESPYHKYINIRNMCEYNKKLGELTSILNSCLTEDELVELHYLTREK